MVKLSATVRNDYGIHCRPSSLIAQEAQRYAGTITIRNGVGQANAKSILELVGLAMSCGQALTIEVHGPDEAAVARQFVELLERHFDFDR